MKQVLQDFKSGELKVEDVPAPGVQPGFVLVRNHVSLISAGTEGGTVKLGRMNLLQKARARPEQVRKVLNVVRTDGVIAATRAVTRSLGMPIPLGYCCAGEVLETGSGVDDLEVGRTVACGGAGWANHAEVVCVPRNLIAPVPEGVDVRHAAFTTLGSIALQSVRVADVRLGENVVVIGLGLVGVTAVQILRAAGCRVFGIDVDEQRVRFAQEHALCEAATRSAGNLEERVLAWSGGLGADAIVVTASAPNNDPVKLAGDLARHKARVVVVGRTEMTAPRETYLFKELELCTSMAYGPGTGDPSYEEQGLDYPVGYVRWTENRNMQAFLDLLANRAVDAELMISHEFDVDDAGAAFDLITGKTDESSLAVLLRYPSEAPPPERKVELSGQGKKRSGDLGLGVIGAGSFAVNFLVPILADLKNVQLRGIASANGIRARALGKRYGFELCSSDGFELIEDPDTHGVVILTRHDSHAPLTVAALEAGKHVFVEKPPAMSKEELGAIVQAAASARKTVQVGFNRRFAPLARKMKNFFAGRAQPMAVTFRSNVGYRPPDHWLHDPIQGGGVILGEAIHFVDFCHWLIGAPPQEVSTFSVQGEQTGVINADNVHISLRFADGSIATVVYVSNGDPAAGRERVEAVAEGGLAILEDFRRLRTFRKGKKKTIRRFQDRGHADQMKAMTEAWRTASPALPLEESAVSTLATLEAVASFNEGTVRRIDPSEIGLSVR